MSILRHFATKCLQAQQFLEVPCRNSFNMSAHLPLTMVGTIYLVGGAIRDRLLQLPVQEQDWLVVGSTPTHMRQAGFRQLDPEFPVFLHPETQEEYALARREFSTTAGYRGFMLDVNPGISLTTDLARRDLTINALAQDIAGNLIDPFQGQQDLEQRRLRHVTAAFIDDPLRLLRIARFKAKLGHLGFTIAPDTWVLLQQMVQQHCLAALKPLYIWREMRKTFEYQQPWRFFEVLINCGAWQYLPLTSKPLAQSQLRTALRALRRACALTEDPVTRFVAFWLLLPESGELAQVLEKKYARLLAQARVAWADFVQLPNNSAQAALSFLQRQQAWHAAGRYLTVMHILQAQGQHPAIIAQLHAARQVTAQIQATTLQAQGISGAAIGQTLQVKRHQLLEPIWRG